MTNDRGSGNSDVSTATRRRRGWIIAGAVILAVILIVGAIAVWPAPSPSQSAQRLTPAEAAQRFDAMIEDDAADDSLLPECHSQRLDPPGVAKGVVLILHGYTSCPNQFRVVAEGLAGDGYTVLLPRLPGHGLAGTIVEAGTVDLQEVADFGDRMIDIAAGLSDEVTVVGLSGGGTLALWLSGHRAEIDRTVSLAPMLNPGVVPTSLSRLAGNLISALPTIAVWWDFDLKERAQVPRYSYAQFQTHSIAAFMALGDAAATSTLEQPGQLFVVVNEADGSVDNGAIRAYADASNRAGRAVDVVTIPARLEFPHEYVDAEDPETKVDEILGALLALIEDGDASAMPK